MITTDASRDDKPGTPGKPAAHRGHAAGERLAARLDEIAATPGAELPGLAFVALDEGRIAFEHYLGRRFIHPTDPSLDLPVTAETRFRVASMSKPFVGVACLLLAEAGLLDLDEDVSRYLGWELRNPAFPDAPITPWMLLSHVSSLRDIERYTLSLSRSLREFFEPGNEAWEGGGHFARSLADPAASAEPDPRLAPGRFYTYCNLGFGVMGTVIERLSGRRFDLFMRERVLEPMGVGGSFNLRLFSDEALAGLGAIYRKATDDETWNPAGPWIAQVDDLRGIRPSANPSDEELAAYVPGGNATWFSPQGGLRASAREVARMAAMLMGRGELDGRRILKPESVAQMRRPRWSFDPASPNGDPYKGRDRRSCLALFSSTDTSDGFGSDLLRAAGGLRMEGHHGDAYGLLGGMLVDVESRKGYVYLMNGTASDPATRPGRFSSYFYWQEAIQDAAAEYLYG